MKKRAFRRTGQFHVYIVRCKDGTFYTGSTNNLEKRLKQHSGGNGSKYVRSKRPIKLVYAKEFKYYKFALNAEREIKTLSREAKEKLASLWKPARRKALK